MAGIYDTEKEWQARFRDTSPTISQLGRTPTDPSGLRNGHLLRTGCEDENLYPKIRGDNGARDFFTERGIRGALPRSMVSSQVLCVNFMLPLADMDGALAAALRAIDHDVMGVVPIEHERRKSSVEFEWVGVPDSLEGGRTRGANVTNVDAFIIAETGAGRRAYLMEWKYTESYGGKSADKRSDERRRRYTDMYFAESSSFSGDVPMDDLLYEPFYQLMRNRLLADRMIANHELGVSDAKVIAVVPEGNAEYREIITSPKLAERFSNLRTVSDIFTATLKEPDKAFATVSPSTLLEAVERECGEAPAISEWAGYMRDRYGL